MGTYTKSPDYSSVTAIDLNMLSGQSVTIYVLRTAQACHGLVKVNEKI